MTKPYILSHFWRSWILRLFNVPKEFHPCSPSQFSLISNLNRRIPWLRHSRNRGYQANWRVYLRDLAKNTERSEKKNQKHSQTLNRIKV